VLRLGRRLGLPNTEAMHWMLRDKRLRSSPSRRVMSWTGLMSIWQRSSRRTKCTTLGGKVLTENALANCLGCRPVAELFKTPGKLRGKTPRTVRRTNLDGVRAVSNLLLDYDRIAHTDIVQIALVESLLCDTQRRPKSLCDLQLEPATEVQDKNSR
jgi:hypothetical protein